MAGEAAQGGRQDGAARAAEPREEPRPPQQDGSAAGSTCAVCRQEPHKYRCPGCGVQTCCLACSKQHKQGSGCSGKRDRLAFVPMQEFTDRHLLSDYRWLEEVGRADDNARRLRPPTPRRELPPHLGGLVHQARLRGVRLLIMPPGMQRRQDNSTRYDFRARKLWWRVEWRFPSAPAAAPAAPAEPAAAAGGAARRPAGCCTVFDARVDEESKLADVLGPHLDYAPGAGGRALALREYARAGAGSLAVLMRKERCPANAPRHYRLDLGRSLRSQLAGKTVIEWPTLLVLLPGEAAAYPTLTEEELQAEQQAGRPQPPAWRGRPPPPPPPRPPPAPSQQQQEQPASGDGAAAAEGAVSPKRRRSDGAAAAAGAAPRGGQQLPSLEPPPPPPQQQPLLPLPPPPLQQQQQQPKYYYYDPTDGADEDAAVLLGGLGEDDGDWAGGGHQQRRVLGGDEGRAAMMALLGQYDEHEIDIGE